MNHAARRAVASIAPLCAAFLLAVLAPRPLAAQTVTLRVANYVPPNSPWENGLRRLAADFERISSGRVKIVFPQSLKASNDADILQKMRLGVDGALITTYGVAELCPDSFALALPTLIRSDAEYDAVLEAVEPLIKRKLDERYVMLAIAKGGWIRFFSKSPIVYPEDLAKARMSVNPGEDKTQKLLQSIGTRTVKGDLSTLSLQLSSNTIDSFYISPVFLASFWDQFKNSIAYMSPFRVAPFVGAVVFTKQSWNKVPAEVRPRLEEAARAVGRQMAKESSQLEEEAIAFLRREGLKIPPYPADADGRWSAVFEERRTSLVAAMFSADFLEAIDRALAAERQPKH